VTEAARWGHGRRECSVLADVAYVAKAPLATDAVHRIDAIFAVEREIKCLPATDRCAVRQDRAANLVAELEIWMRVERAGSPAMPRSPGPWTTSSSAGRPSPASSTMAGSAERRRGRTGTARHRPRPQGLALRRLRARRRHAHLIKTAKLNGVDPQTWLASVLRRINDHPASRLNELLPRRWRQTVPAA
jgi:hypothetical protein